MRLSCIQHRPPVQLSGLRLPSSQVHIEPKANVGGISAGHIRGKRSIILFTSVACPPLVTYSWAQRCSPSDALIAYRPLLTRRGRPSFLPPGASPVIRIQS